MNVEQMVEALTWEKKMNHTKQTLRNHPNAKTSGILDPNFRYTPSYATDIRETFKQMGWIAPSIKKQTMTYEQYEIESRIPF